ncbi:MAG: AAA family ATPase [Acetobacteraceae bacterium]
MSGQQEELGLAEAPVIERAKAMIGAEKLTIAEAAKLAGVGESTLAAWLSGTYAGNNERVEARVKSWLGSHEHVRRARKDLPQIPWAETPTGESILSALDHAQTIPDVVIVTGGAGVGKTMACRRYAETRPNIWMLTAEPSLASAHALLEYLGDVTGVAEPAPTKRSRAIAARLQGTHGLVIVDEAQHLTTGAVDQLRAVHDRADIGLALVGNEQVWARVDGGGRKAEFAQLFSRVGMRVKANRPTARDIGTVLDAAEVGEQKQRGLLRAIAAKPGALRGMVKALRVARLLAAGAGEELSELHIQAAWTRIAGDAGSAESVA